MDTTASRWEPESDDEHEAALAELKRGFSAWVGQSDDAVDPDAVTRHSDGTTLPPRAWDHLVPHRAGRS